MKKRLRIAFLLESNPVSGATQVILALAGALRKRGHTVSVLVHFRQKRYFSSKVQIEETSDFQAAVDLKFDVAVATHVSQILALAGRLRIPFLWLIQGYEGFFTLKHPEKMEVDRIPSIRDVYQIPVPKIVISKFLLNFLIEHFGPRIHHLPLGLDRRWFSNRPKSIKRVERRFMVLGPSRLLLKGIPDAFQSFRILRGKIPHFLVVYVSPNEEDRQWISRYPFPIEFYVRPSQRKLAELYRDSDVFVAPSWYEDFPYPPLEAMASGVPVVGYGNSGIRNYAVDGQNCLLTRIGDSAMLARKLTELFADAVLRRRLIAGGRRTAARMPTWDQSAEHFESILYQEVEQFQPRSINLAERVRQSMKRRLQRDGFAWPNLVQRFFLRAPNKTVIASDPKGRQTARAKQSNKTVIASDPKGRQTARAKQSLALGLLRRSAPRNDDKGLLLGTLSKRA